MQVEETGQAVLATAEDLVSRSHWLVDGGVALFQRSRARRDQGRRAAFALRHLTASERPLQELLVMLIEQRNAKGGLLGRPIEPVIVNPRSDAAAYGALARVADPRTQGRGDLRLLDLGLAQGGSAGRGGGRRAAVLPEPIRGRGSIAQHLLPRRDAASAGVARDQFPARAGLSPVLPGGHRLHLPAHDQCGAQGLPCLAGDSRQRRRRTLHAVGPEGLARGGRGNPRASPAAARRRSLRPSAAMPTCISTASSRASA